MRAHRSAFARLASLALGNNCTNDCCSGISGTDIENGARRETAIGFP